MICPSISISNAMQRNYKRNQTQNVKNNCFRVKTSELLIHRVPSRIMSVNNKHFNIKLVIMSCESTFLHSKYHLHTIHMVKKGCRIVQIRCSNGNCSSNIVCPFLSSIFYDHGVIPGTDSCPCVSQMAFYKTFCCTFPIFCVICFVALLENSIFVDVSNQFTRTLNFWLRALK